MSTFKFQPGELIKGVGKYENYRARVIACVPGDYQDSYKVFWLNRDTAPVQQFGYYEKETMETFYRKTGEICGTKC